MPMMMMMMLSPTTPPPPLWRVNGHRWQKPRAAITISSPSFHPLYPLSVPGPKWHKAVLQGQVGDRLTELDGQFWIRFRLSHLPIRGPTGVFGVFGLFGRPRIAIWQDGEVDRRVRVRYTGRNGPHKLSSQALASAHVSAHRITSDVDVGHVG